VQVLKNSPGALLASFIYQNELQPGLTLITGPRGAGKTRWCLRLAEHARLKDLDIRGLVSPPVFEDDQKIGIDLLDLTTGEHRPLAYRKGDFRGDILTSDWQIVAETLQWGNHILEGITHCDVFVLDEVGPLEFDHGVGLAAGLNFVDASVSLPCYVVVRPSLLDAARKRWPWALVLEISTEAES
jgi:nucleoside-triphosphatase